MDSENPHCMTVEEALQRIAAHFQSEVTAGRVRSLLDEGVEVLVNIRISENRHGGYNVTMIENEVRHRNEVINLSRCP